MQSILLNNDRYRCYCARENNINHEQKLKSVTIHNDTRNDICVSQLSSYGIIRQPLVCLAPNTGVKLDDKISFNENIKIRTPITEFYSCSGIIKPQDNSILKVSEIEKNRWSSAC